MKNLIDLRRRLNNARRRAKYWSGNPSFTSQNFSVKNGNNDFGYELAMVDISSLCDEIEKLTGIRPKETDPKKEFDNFFIDDIMPKLGNTKNEE